MGRPTRIEPCSRELGYRSHGRRQKGAKLFNGTGNLITGGAMAFLARAMGRLVTGAMVMAVGMRFMLHAPVPAVPRWSGKTDAA